MDVTRQNDSLTIAESPLAEGWFTKSFQINWGTTVYIVILLLAILRTAMYSKIRSFTLGRP